LHTIISASLSSISTLGTFLA